MKCLPNQNFVILGQKLTLQSMIKYQTLFANCYRVGHCMIGTVLIAFAGEPLTILVLIAR
jgi:hypothetical protein